MPDFLLDLLRLRPLDAVSRLLELAWYDGFGWGCAVGLVAGALLGYLVGRDRR
jgi:hypothetical protein